MLQQPRDKTHLYAVVAKAQAMYAAKMSQMAVGLLEELEAKVDAVARPGSMDHLHAEWFDQATGDKEPHDGAEQCNKCAESIAESAKEIANALGQLKELPAAPSPEPPPAPAPPPPAPTETPPREPDPPPRRFAGADGKLKINHASADGDASCKTQ